MRFGIWNCRGWSLKENDNSQFRKLVLQNSDCDVFAICETFLRGNEEPKVNGYTWYGNNRTSTHRNAVRGSGGVWVFAKSELLDEYDITPLVKSVEDILWIQLKCKSSNLSMYLAVCYLPLNESSRPIDQEMFFDNLLQQVYCNQNRGYTIILRDFNSRCGPNNDYIEGVDDIVPRSVIDYIENLRWYLTLQGGNSILLPGSVKCFKSSLQFQTFSWHRCTMFTKRTLCCDRT